MAMASFACFILKACLSLVVDLGQKTDEANSVAAICAMRRFLSLAFLDLLFFMPSLFIESIIGLDAGKSALAANAENPLMMQLLCEQALRNPFTDLST